MIFIWYTIFRSGSLFNGLRLILTIFVGFLHLRGDIIHGKWDKFFYEIDRIADKKQYYRKDSPEDKKRYF